MISTHYLRKNAFILKKALSQDDLGRFIDSMLVLCPAASNRTHHIPILHDSKSFAELETFLKSSDGTLRSLTVGPEDSSNGLPASFFRTVKATYMEQLRKLAENEADIYFHVRVRHKPTKHDAGLVFEIDERGCWITVKESEKIPLTDLDARLAEMQRLIRLCSMPVELRLSGDTFELKHAQGGLVEFGRRYDDNAPKNEVAPPKLPGRIKCSFPALDMDGYLKVIRRIFRDPDFAPRNSGSWILRDICNRPNARATFDVLKGLKMPCRKIELRSTYCIDHFRDYRTLVAVTQVTKKDVGASLMEITFGEGRTCQFDVITCRNGMSWPILSFDAVEDGAALASQLSLELEQVKW